MNKQLFYLLVLMLFVCVVFKARTYIKVHAEECTTASGSLLFGAERR